jgi:hypothetical protein
VNARAASQAPAFPRKLLSGQCMKCQDRLVPGYHPSTLVHQSTGTVRCPPVTPLCGVCDHQGLVPCSDPECQIVGHPGLCLQKCSCCMSWGCGAHVSTVTGLCIPCSTHGPGEHREMAS